MDLSRLIHQAMLYAHVVAFAIALSAVLREDLAVLRSRRIDPARLAQTARIVTRALIALWATGLALVGFAVGFDGAALLANAKLMAKLLVVSALTANGLALHRLAFPLLARPLPRRAVALAVVLGAISTASWLYASFVGVARVIAPALSFADFMALYGALLAGAVAVALAFVRPRIERLSGAHTLMQRSSENAL